MKTFAKFMSEIPKPVKAILITTIALASSHFIVYDLSSISYFAPMEKASDFRFSDFYTLVANGKTDIMPHDENIVIVPVDGCTRSEIAMAIEEIDYCAPAAVGLDIGFTEPKDHDNDLLPTVLASCDNLVLPTLIVSENGHYHTESQSYYDEFIEPSGGYAPINIEGVYESITSTRMFSPCFETDEGRLESFSFQLAGLKNPESADRLYKRQSDEEFISFFPREYDTVYPSEILANESLIRDRVVMIGKLHDKADTHITPIGNRTPGLMIHAYIASTILDSDYIRKLSDLETFLIAFSFTLIFVLMTLLLNDSPAGDLVVRCLQIVLLYAMILAGSVAFIQWRIDLDFAYPIIAIGLGVGACDVYAGLFHEKGLLDSLYVFYKKIKKQKPNEPDETEKIADSVGSDSTDNSQSECDLLGV